MAKNYKDKEVGSKFLFFLIYPLGGFLYSIFRDFKSASTRWIFFLFIVLYGISFRAEYKMADSFRHVEEFNVFISDASTNYSLVLQEYFSKDSSIKDIFQYSLFYLTDFLAGNNYHVFFCLVAIVFGYFLVKSLKFITSDESYHNTTFFLILTLIFLFSNPIFNINGVRFWTAAWVATYATFQVLINRNWRYILLLVCLPMIHGSFYIYLFFLLIAYFVRRFYNVLPYFFFISFFFTDVALNFIPNITGFLPPFLQTMVWNYTESDEALLRMSGVTQEALYARVLISLPKYFHLLLIFLLVRSKKYFIDDFSKEILGFLLALGTMINISSMIPSMGRFYQLLIPLYVYLWVHNSKIMLRYSKLLFSYIIIALYPAFRIIRIMSYTTDPVFYLSNAVHIFIKGLLI